MDEQAETYPSFWHNYLRRHANAGTRAMHFVGTFVALVGIAAGIINLNVWLALTGIAVGYAFAWVSHILIEHNRPCTFGHPGWSLVSELRMFRLWLGGELPQELRKAGVPDGKPERRA